MRSEHMLRKLAALLFVLAIAGQVSAGICVCAGSQSSKAGHSCCKRKKASGNSISKKPCCDMNCMSQRSGAVAQDRVDASAKVKFHELLAAVTLPRPAFPHTRSRKIIAVPDVFGTSRLKYARPPDLYLRHHAFLI